VNVAATVVPFDTQDSFATHDPVYGIGGWREVPSYADLSTIPTPRLREGMVVHVMGDQPYQYISGVWLPLVTTVEVNGVVVPNAGVSGAASTSGGLYTAPPDLSVWTVLNEGSSVLSQATTPGPIAISIPDTTLLNWRGLVQPVVAAPYTYTAFIRSMQYPNGLQSVGMSFYDGTKLMSLEQLTQGPLHSFLRVEKIDNITTDGSTCANTANPTYAGFTYGGLWVQLSNDGTDLSFRFSLDGQNWNVLYSEPVGEFVTPTHVGFTGLSQNAGSAVWASLLSWRQS
jgi:hypothetical protein